MPLISRLGAASSRGFGEFAQQTAANYIEDVFSTYLYTATQTSFSINNEIDLSVKGGLVWFKDRSGNRSHALFDTVRGVSSYLRSNTTGAAVTNTNALTSFNSNGFTLGTDSDGVNTNYPAGNNFVSWTFRKQPKFFDIVTYTGDGSGGGRAISHGLGAVPGMIIVKCTSHSGTDWSVFHRSINSGRYGYALLNSSGAADTTTGIDWNVSSTTFCPPTWENTGSRSYVAYLFAHDAGGFGADGSQNVISCGSYTGNGSATGPSINLGYEPQYVLIKAASIAQDWFVADVMRGMPVGSGDVTLSPNLSDAELTGLNYIAPTATGFNITSAGSSFNSSGETYIYMAIRRGPMRTPTSGTSVFTPTIYTADGTIPYLISSPNFPADLLIGQERTNASYNGATWGDRLRGSPALLSSGTDAETNTGAFTSTGSGAFSYQNSVSVSQGSGATRFYLNSNGTNYIAWIMRRAPGFFDEVCYSDGASPIYHNLGVQPQFIITKLRNGVYNWTVSVRLSSTEWWQFNSISTSAGSSLGNANPYATSTSIEQSWFSSSQTGGTYVGYLFATCPGVSKVGSYTGTGATQTISCGFTGGARYVLIKRTDSTGDWWVWDTARGMVAGTDPRLAYNSTAAETNANWVYTTTGGFQIVTSDATVNASGGTYIYLAIA